MYVAANKGYLDICKFLYFHGAKDDIRRVNRSGMTPFLTAAGNWHDEVLQWLVLNGALCADDNSEVIEAARLEQNIRPRHYYVPNIYHSLTKLLEWAEEVIQDHASLLMFLCGTLPSSATSSGHSRILQNLSGHLGVRKHIAAFVRIECVTTKHLRMLHQLVEVLPSIFSDQRFYE